MIDLDALAAELVAAGVTVRVPFWVSDGRLVVGGDGFIVYPSGAVCTLSASYQIGEQAWRALDIIRRHVEPRPADDLRERAAKAAFDAFYAEGTPFTEIERAMFGQVADAVLAIIGDAGAQGVGG